MEGCDGDLSQFSKYRAVNGSSGQAGTGIILEIKKILPDGSRIEFSDTDAGESVEADTITTIFLRGDRACSIQQEQACASECGCIERDIHSTCDVQRLQTGKAQTGKICNGNFPAGGNSEVLLVAHAGNRGIVRL